MATDTTTSAVSQIGETAGLIWNTLSSDGSLSLSKLTKSIDAPRDVIMQAVGWLAREDKITIEERGRVRVISLRE